MSLYTMLKNKSSVRFNNNFYNTYAWHYTWGESIFYVERIVTIKCIKWIRFFDFIREVIPWYTYLICKIMCLKFLFYIGRYFFWAMHTNNQGNIISSVVRCHVFIWSLRRLVKKIITVTLQWARWRLKSPASPLFIQTQIKENIKAPRHWPLCGEFTGDRWTPRTKGQFDEVIMPCVNEWFATAMIQHDVFLLG